ncbi:MAG: peptide chain release factor N(5)-glutamine methyltransferase [Planctomycetota bacterium]|nr:MAG: peptide chain release factor N(5)-glutamine methyltransferase [Planctomycetota bacterium]
MDEAPTLLNLVRRSGAYLVERGITNGRREAEWIFCYALDCERLQLFTEFDRLLDGEEVARLRQLVQRRGRREPLAYILGTQPFCGLELQVSPAVLVPRPETEELVALVAGEALAQGEGARLLDVGTGSGAIALALAAALPQAEVWGVDISAEALACAQANGEALGARVRFAASDLLLHAPGPWQVIVANLPYVGEDERARCDPELAFEPALALFSGPEGLDAMARLLGQLAAALAEEGVCWLEHGDTQGAALARLVQSHGFASRTVTDSAERDRFTRVWRPAGGP